MSPDSECWKPRLITASSLWISPDVLNSLNLNLDGKKEEMMSKGVCIGFEREMGKMTDSKITGETDRVTVRIDSCVLGGF
jgi:hypothetical protein